jgi:flagellar protein FlgJ
MNITSQYADVYTDFQGLSQLRAEAGSGKNDQATLRKVAGQFEALFIQMMLKSMRDANLGEGLMDSEHVKTYQSMFDQQIALDLSKGGSLGLADMMVRQLSRGGKMPDNSAAVAAPLAMDGAIQTPVPAKQQSLGRADGTDADTGRDAKPARDWRPATPAGFVKELWPHAQRAADELGTTPEVLLAQAALETGWGQHIIRGQDGRNSFNLFGIKADAQWQGARAVTETVEFRDGLMRRERAPFRAYDSLAESFSDYVDFLKTNPRYQEALNQAANAPAFARALSQAGYATDPDYHGKIERILDSSRLQDAVSGAIQSQPVRRAGDEV